MTLCLLESWESVATADLATRGWVTYNSGGGSSVTVGTTQSRTGTRAFVVTSSNGSNNTKFVQRGVGSANEHATMILGFALYKPTALAGDVALLSSDSGATKHVLLKAAADGTLTVYRANGSGGASLGSSGAGAIGAAGWYYIELKATLHDTTGAVTVRVNGTAVITLTNVDTKNAGTKTVFDGVGLVAANADDANNANGVVNHYDDVYVANGAGSVNTTFLGDVRVRALTPSGNGNSSQFLGSDADSTNNYLLVDDPQPDTADYVGSATVDQKDTYAFSDLSDTSGTVLGVQISALAAKTDAATRSLALVTRSAGADYDGSDAALSLGANTYVTQVRELDPATSALWLRAAVNAAEFGVKVR